jgi:hypothetical protein
MSSIAAARNLVDDLAVANLATAGPLGVAAPAV